jgi:hypothetical protein
MDDDGRIRYAHQIAWQSEHGELPTEPPADGSDRYEIHHRCTNRSCCNPAHLFLTTRRSHAEQHNAIRTAIREAKAA